MVNEPLAVPQLALTGVNTTAVGPGVFTTVAVVGKVHPLASFTTTLYIPAARLLYTVVPENAPPLKLYVIGPVPPVVAPMVTVPFALPQVQLVVVVACAVGPGLFPTTTFCV